VNHPSTASEAKLISFALTCAQARLERPTPPGFIHLGVAQHICSVLRELGAGPDTAIAEAGLDPRLFDNPGSLVSEKALGKLLLHCIERTHCPHFGLLVGQKATLDSLRLVGVAMRVCDTVGEAPRTLQAHLRIQNRIAIVPLEVRDGVAMLCFSLYEPDAEGALLVAEGGLATSVQVIRDLCGADWSPSEVLIPRRAPANPEPYRACFRAPVRFDQETAALVFPSALLARRLPDANPLLRRAFEQRLLEMERACPTDLVDELRRMLRAELSRRRASATDVAQHYSVHRRTLNRHLKAAGTGFRAVADGVRYEIARQLIADTDIPLAQISAMLDFSEPAAFTRAFHRWSGDTPSDYRTKHKPDIGLDNPPAVIQRGSK